MFTIAHLIIIDVFPLKTHALAGAIFNTVSQFGSTGGMAVMAVVSSTYSKRRGNVTQSDPDSLLYGYRAVFWSCFVLMCLTCFMAPVGLRTTRKLGGQVHSMV